MGSSRFGTTLLMVTLIVAPGRALAGEPGVEPSGAKGIAIGEDTLAESDASGRVTVRQGSTEVASGQLVFSGQKGSAFQDALSAERLIGAETGAGWSLAGDSAPGAPHVELRMAPAGRSAAISGVIDFRRPEEVAGWEYRLTLPAKLHAGADVTAGGKRAKLGGGRGSMLRTVGREFRVERGGKTVLRVLRDVPCLIEVLDLRDEGGDFVVRLAVEGDELGGARRGIFCLALAASTDPVPPLVYHHSVWAAPSPGRPIRCELGVLAEYASPFNPAEIEVEIEVEPPNGARFTQLAYYTQPFSSRPSMRPAKAGAAGVEPGQEEVQVETEELVPAGPPGWEGAVEIGTPGVHRFNPHVRTGRGAAEARGEARSLLVAAGGARMGPLAASARDGRFLAGPDGRAVFLIGHNLGWLVSETGPLSVERWCAALDRMRDAGLNYCRIWMCSWSLGIEGRQPFTYDLGNAWKLERILYEARDRGIHVQLCLDNFHDFLQKRNLSPFFAGREPVCRSGREFFESAEARRIYMSRLRYLVARYGHFDNLMAWELFNEIDYCIDGDRTREAVALARNEYLVPWVRSAAGGLSAMDRGRRPVTCSLSDGNVWPELSGAPEIGLAESHVYLYMGDPKTGQPATIARAALEAAGRLLAGHGKPGFVSEFGFGADGGPVSPINDVDRLGVHMHNGLWSSALSGQAGAAALWWWDSYLAPGDAAPDGPSGDDRYQHYRALTAFLRGVDWLAGWRELTAVSATPAGSEPRPTISGLRTRTAALAWVTDPENTWYRRSVENYSPVRIEGAAFSLDGMAEGRYEIEWWDTYTGRRLTADVATANAQGTLLLKVPAFSRDIAARVRLLGEGTGHDDE